MEGHIYIHHCFSDFTCQGRSRELSEHASFGYYTLRKYIRYDNSSGAPFKLKSPALPNVSCLCKWSWAGKSTCWCVVRTLVYNYTMLGHCTKPGGCFSPQLLVLVWGNEQKGSNLVISDGIRYIQDSEKSIKVCLGEVFSWCYIRWGSCNEILCLVLSPSLPRVHLSSPCLSSPPWHISSSHLSCHLLVLSICPALHLSSLPLHLFLTSSPILLPRTSSIILLSPLVLSVCPPLSSPLIHFFSSPFLPLCFSPLRISPVIISSISHHLNSPASHSPPAYSSPSSSHHLPHKLYHIFHHTAHPSSFTSLFLISYFIISPFSHRHHSLIPVGGRPSTLGGREVGRFRTAN